MSIDIGQIQHRLVMQWDDLQTAIQAIYGSVVVKPTDGFSIFVPVSPQPNPADAIEFLIKPAVFNVPERGSDLRPGLFVVIEGSLSLSASEWEQHKQLVTTRFGTHAAYFRPKGQELSHIYGAHHDYAVDEVGHPVFHSQLKDFSSFLTHVSDYFDIQYVPGGNQVKGLLKTVRLPTAQLDVFAAYLQIVADHLLHKDSSPEEKKAFNQLCASYSTLKGAEKKGLSSLGGLQSCLRSRHWYPAVA